MILLGRCICHKACEKKKADVVSLSFFLVIKVTSVHVCVCLCVCVSVRNDNCIFYVLQRPACDC